MAGCPRSMTCIAAGPSCCYWALHWLERAAGAVAAGLDAAVRMLQAEAGVGRQQAQQAQQAQQQAQQAQGASTAQAQPRHAAAAAAAAAGAGAGARRPTPAAAAPAGPAAQRRLRAEAALQSDDPALLELLKQHRWGCALLGSHAYLLPCAALAVLVKAWPSVAAGGEGRQAAGVGLSWQRLPRQDPRPRSPLVYHPLQH